MLRSLNTVYMSATVLHVLDMRQYLTKVIVNSDGNGSTSESEIS